MTLSHDMNVNLHTHAIQGTTTILFIILQAVSLLLVCTLSYIVFKRRKTRIQLSSGKCALPTVCWLPRFVNYLPEKDDDEGDDDDPNNHKNKNDDDTCTQTGSGSGQQHPKQQHNHKKLPSSNITNILPRMERLNGPYGMYATVYGISTKVVHVAHPIPAKAMLMGHSSGIPIKSKAKTKVKANQALPSGSGSGRIRSSMATTLGAIKRPAYDHFFNFFGEGVFTADGATWKSKRASVIHCLLKGCTKDNSEESLRLEREANRAADRFLWSATACACTAPPRQHVNGNGNRNGDVNIVPLLQRATIGLIYRFLTHHEIETHFFDRDTNVNHALSSSGVISTTGQENIASLLSESDTSLLDTEDSDSACNSSTSSTPPSSSVSSQDADADADAMDKPSSTTKHDDKSGENNYRNNPFRDLTSYLEAITKIRMIILAQSRSIWFLLPRWCYRAFSSMFQEEERQMTTIRKFAKAACLNAQIGSPLQMLRFRESHNPNSKDGIQNGTVTNKALLDEAITLLFAGQDTSAATLSWALHLLSLNPCIQNRLVKEIREHLVSEGLEPSSTDMFTKKMVTKMTYLDAVVKEVMRLYPVAPFVVRNVPEDLTIPRDPSNSSFNNDITIPKDTLACVWIYSLHRNKKLWNRPDDFIPERWIDPELQKLDPAQTTQKGSFMPFAAGPRNCVGQPLAHIVLRIMLARIINECEVIDKRRAAYNASLTEDEMVERGVRLRKDMQAGFTVLPSGGVSLSVYRRMKLD